MLTKRNQNGYAVPINCGKADCEFRHCDKCAFVDRDMILEIIEALCKYEETGLVFKEADTGTCAKTKSSPQIEEKRFKPKKPIYDCMKLLYICPNCGEFLQTYNEHQKYSMCCGQLLDWD